MSGKVGGESVSPAAGTLTDHSLYSAAGNRYRTSSDHGRTPHTPKKMMEYQAEQALSELSTIPVQATLKLKSRAKVGK